MEKEADRNSIVTPTGSSLHLASRQPGAATEAYTSDPSTQKKKMRIPIR